MQYKLRGGFLCYVLYIKDISTFSKPLSTFVDKKSSFGRLGACTNSSQMKMKRNMSQNNDDVTHVKQKDNSCKSKRKSEFDSQKEVWNLLEGSSTKSSDVEEKNKQSRRHLKMQAFLLKNQTKFESDLKNYQKLEKSKVKVDDSVGCSRTGKNVFSVSKISQSSKTDTSNVDFNDTTVPSSSNSLSERNSIMAHKFPPLPPDLNLHKPPPPPNNVIYKPPPPPNFLDFLQLPPAQKSSHNQSRQLAINTTSPPHHSYLSNISLRDLAKFSNLRSWTGINNNTSQWSNQSSNSVSVRLMSYNVLAQNLLTFHPYLYSESPKEALNWDFRWKGICREILDTRPDIVCLQEVQFGNPNHFLSLFKPFFSALGYKYVLKARTGNKDDGCATLYKSDMFTLEDVSGVEYKIDRVKYLDRDNVGLVCRLVSNSCPEIKLVVANTHLLYNPKRTDIRLCQSAILLAEIDRLAMTSEGFYLPTVVTGDFNSNPESPVFELFSSGSFTYQGLRTGSSGGRQLPSRMLPDSLGLSDSCQWQVMLEQRRQSNIFSTGSGTFSHNFKFQSVHDPINQGVTTYQDNWVMVDYMMFSGLDLVARQDLPTAGDLHRADTRIPSYVCPSDHLPLVADFLLN